MTKRPQVRHDGTSGQEMTYDELLNPLLPIPTIFGRFRGPLGMTKRPQIGHHGTSGQEIANDEVGQHLQGSQVQVGGPQVPLPSHGDEIENPNWASMVSRI